MGYIKFTCCECNAVTLYENLTKQPHILFSCFHCGHHFEDCSGCKDQRWLRFFKSVFKRQDLVTEVLDPNKPVEDSQWTRPDSDEVYVEDPYLAQADAMLEARSVQEATETDHDLVFDDSNEEVEHLPAEDLGAIVPDRCLTWIDEQIVAKYSWAQSETHEPVQSSSVSDELNHDFESIEANLGFLEELLTSSKAAHADIEARRIQAAKLMEAAEED